MSSVAKDDDVNGDGDDFVIRQDSQSLSSPCLLACQKSNQTNYSIPSASSNAKA